MTSTVARVGTALVLLAGLLLAAPAPGAPAAGAARTTLTSSTYFTSVRDASMVEFRGYTYFFADDDVHGRELWRSDGTPAGTTLFADLTPGDASSDTAFGTGPNEMAATGNRLYFLTGSFPYTLWYTDGTAAPRAASTSVPYFRSGIITQPDGVYLLNLAFVYGMRDSETTLRLLDGDDGINSLNVDGATLRGSLYFGASASGQDFELWRLDLTGGPAQRVADIRSGSAGSEPRAVTATSTHVYFVADDGYHGRELWVSDGTAAGTRRLTDLATGTRSAALSNLVAVGNQLYYAATRQGASRATLWRTTGSTPQPVGDLGQSGTGTVQPFADRAVVSQGSHLWAVRPGNRGLERLSTLFRLAGAPNLGGDLYFRSYQTTTARSSLYRSGGAAASTVAVVTLPQWSPEFLTPAGKSLLYFVWQTGLGYRARFYQPGRLATTVAVRLSRKVYRARSKPRVTATARVSGPPTGRVTFYDRGRKLRTVTLVDGRASLRLPARLARGRHRIEARIAATRLTAAGRGSAVLVVRRARR